MNGALTHSAGVRDRRKGNGVSTEEFFREFRRRNDIRRNLRGNRTIAERDKIVPADKLGRRQRKRKRTAVALGLAAMGLSGTSGMAIGAGDDFPSMSQIHYIPGPDVRRDAGDLTVSDELLRAMIQEEGVRYDVYRDVAGYPTVGVGHLVLAEDNLRVGDRISHEQAMRLLESDLGKAEEIVRDLVGDLEINQYEFDALVDLAFNVGGGNLSASQSPRLNQAIQAGDHEAIAAELEYHHAGNAVANGLIHRSERRTRIFMEGDYRDPRMTQA